MTIISGTEKASTTSSSSTSSTSSSSTSSSTSTSASVSPTTALPNEASLNGWHKKRHVCIIGSGASGLCAARYMLEHRLDFTYDHFEQTANLGGTWVYSDTDQDTNDAGHPLYSCMYKNLWTNLPLSIMAFPDFPASGEKKFVTHERVRAYLQNYSKHYRVCDRIKYLHQVEKVHRNEDNWSVTVLNIQTQERFTRKYDAVMVCAGIYYNPHIPDTFRNTSFQGKIVHSKYYRKPDDYNDQTVLVVGAGPSGMDISVEISRCAKKTYFAHRMKKSLGTLPPEIEEINDKVVEVLDKGVKFASGRQLDDIDVILLTTGFEYSFSFLDDSCGVKIPKQGLIEHLYLHFINIEQPTMGIWSVARRSLPFPMFDQQVNTFVKHLLGEIMLPSKEQMLAEAKADLKMRLDKGIEKKHAHNMVLSNLLWEYEQRLCEIGKVKRVPESSQKIFEMLERIRLEDPTDYKRMVFDIESDGKITYSKQRRRP